MKSCAIIGHRPSRFKWKYNENNSGCKRLKKRLREQFAALYDQGVRRFYMGGALGTDLWAGEILLQMKACPEYSDIQLVAALPFEGYDEAWDKKQKERMKEICDQSEIVVVCKQPGAVSYKRRNYYMVDQANILLAVYDNDRSLRSGTGVTVNYARKKGLLIILIHPDTAMVSNE